MGLARSFKYRNIPKLSPKTNYSSIEILKFACDLCADLVSHDSDKNQAIKMVELLAYDQGACKNDS